MGAKAPNDVDWGEVYAAALAIALECVPKQDAEDVVMDGVRKVIEGSAPYDRAGGKSLPEHVVAVGFNERRNRRRKIFRRMRRAFVNRFIQTFDEKLPATPEEELSAAEHLEEKARLFEALLEACRDDADEVALLECLQKGIEKPRDQQEETGFAIDRIHNARRRIKRRALALAEEDGERQEEAS
jgi:hypothetical protein